MLMTVIGRRHETVVGQRHDRKTPKTENPNKEGRSLNPEPK
jgi:hypothetical protein